MYTNILNPARKVTTKEGRALAEEDRLNKTRSHESDSPDDDEDDEYDDGYYEE